MPEEMETSRRLLYGGIAACFFIAGLILIVLLFWMVFPVVLGFGLWVLAGLFLNLAIKGRTFADWNAEKIARRELAKIKEQS
jgi:fatty acid desaturase